MQQRFLSWTGAAFLAGAVCAAPGVLAGEAPTREEIESTRATLSRWVETQEIISREKKDWQQAKEILLSRIDIVKKEIAQVEEKLASARTGESESDKARSEVVSEIHATRQTTDELEGHVKELEGKVKKLYTALPESLREKVRPLYDRMPDLKEGEVSKVSLAERFQNVLGILNEVTRLNSEINVVSEIRPLSDGKPSEVRTIYVGLGQAYFVSARGEAGVGRPTEDGWTWQPANQLAREITHALEILQNKSGPKFVPLPVEIR